MKAQLTETTNIEEERIWRVILKTNYHENSAVVFTFGTKKAAKDFKKFWDEQESQPFIMVRH